MMSDPSASIGVPTTSRRQFLDLVTMAGGVACFGMSHRASGQDPDDRAAIDESLRGKLIFWASPKTDPENAGVFSYDLGTRKWQRVLGGVNPEWFCRASPDGKSFALSEGELDQPRVSIIGPEGRTKIAELRSRVF